MAKAFIKREQSARPRPPVPDVRGSYNSQEWGQQGGRTGPWGRTADPAGQPRKRAEGFSTGKYSLSTHGARATGSRGENDP